MNRIYQGRVSQVEIPIQVTLPNNPGQPISAPAGEKVAQPDEVSPESGETTEVRCRVHSINFQLSTIKFPRPHHELFQDAANF